MKQNSALFAFNRGLISALGLARTDQKRTALSAETMDNWICRVLGPMSLRPGWAYLGATASNAAARYLKFIFGTSDTALIELTALVMRVWISDALITRGSVSTAVTNGTFTGNITGWTDDSDAGGSAAYEATNKLKLVSNGTARAIAYQEVTVAGGDQGDEHALSITIDRGPVTLRVGSTNGDDDYVTETDLDTGYHSIAFTPTGNFFIHFSSTKIYKKLISNCTVAASGVMTLTAIWPAADLSKVRYDQSADIIFVACDGYRPQKIERRGAHPGGRSWSVCDYQSDDGPFRIENTGPITMTATATTGDTTLTASQPYFRSTHVGAIFSVTTPGQTQTVTAAAQNTFTSAITVTGIGASRSFGITLTGTLAASTVTLQSSTDEATWSDVTGQSFTATTTTAYADGLDNQIIYYRIGIKTGDYGGADSVVCTLIYAGGTQVGKVRITAFSTNVSVSVQVLSAIGATSATDVWAEGQWSSYRGFPTSVRFHEGRLWWFGRNGIWGSISDAFYSFDAETEGASGPLNRTIGSGSVDVINFALSMQRLVIGSEGREISIRPSSLDAPITPTDFNMKDASTQGSANVEAWKIDQRGIYVQRGGIKVYELSFDIQSVDYNSVDLTALVPELGSPGIVRMDIQRQPDTRIHCVRSDGVVMIGIFDKAEEVLAWQTVSTDGTVEDVCILPSTANTTEDQVYYVVNRTVNGSTVRHLEKWALESECRGSTTSNNADSFITFTNSPASTTVSGLDHLEGEDVVVWADGAPALDSSDDIETFTVSGGAITLGTAATTGVAGLPYTAQWKSTKLGLQVDATRAVMNRDKRLGEIGFILAYFYPKAIQFGPDFTHLDDMPAFEQGTTLSGIQTSYDNATIPFPGVWETDLRLCLQAEAPRPVTVMAVSVDLETT